LVTSCKIQIAGALGQSFAIFDFMFLIGIRHALIGTILGVVSHPKFNVQNLCQNARNASFWFCRERH